MDCMGSPTRKTERCSVRVGIPGREQQRDEPVLGARGVLKLVHEKVAQIAADGEEAVGRVFEHFDGGEGYLSEVDGIAFGKNDSSSAMAWRRTVKRWRSVVHCSSV